MGKHLSGSRFHVRPLFIGLSERKISITRRCYTKMQISRLHKRLFRWLKRPFQFRNDCSGHWNNRLCHGNTRFDSPNMIVIGMCRFLNTHDRINPDAVPFWEIFLVVIAHFVSCKTFDPFHNFAISLPQPFFKVPDLFSSFEKLCE